MNKILVLLLSVFISATAIGQDSVFYYQNGNIVEDTISVEEITVTASYKATKSTPFSFKNLTPQEIDFRGREMEPAGLLQHTPSVTVNTDNGLFTGYSYFRLRGIDQTRINVTLNGVPMNEPEDQGIYFNNYANFMQTVSDIQIIRGAGVSKSGVSSYGGSINFDSNEPEVPSEISLSYGSYNTWNATAQASFDKGWMRASYLTTDGYKHHSGNKSYSLFYGYAPFKGARLTGFVGQQYNQMAWIGSSFETIESDHRSNANTENEQDAFLYVHNQLQYSHSILRMVLYHTYLNGWYNMDFGHFGGNFNESMYKLQLNSNWIGTNINVRALPHTFVGISAHTYKRDHTNAMAFPDEYETYNENYGTRNEVSPYIKTNIKLSKFNFYGDVQYRFSTFGYHDITGDFDLERQDWHFLNWSLGSTLNMSDNVHVYFGLGKNHREPTRTDLFGGMDEYIEEFAVDVVPEEVLDFEAGIKVYGNNVAWKLNTFYMDFQNEIVLNGQVGPNAIVIHSNVAESYRAGIESDLQIELGNWKFLNVFSLSDNVIIQDDTRFTHVLSPSFITTSDVVYNLGKWTSGVSLRYNGESYIDLTNENKIPSYYTINFYNSVKINKFDIGLRLNNVLNELYYTYGNIGFDGNPGYFQQVGFNFILSLKYQF